jgi:hypothetical protein
MRRLTIPLAVAVAAMAALAALAFGPSAGAGSAAPSAGPSCDADDQLLTMDVMHTGDGGGRTPEDALERDVHSQYRTMPSSNFHRTGGSSSEVQFAYDKGSRRLAVATVDKAGRGWTVDTFAACNKALTAKAKDGND